MKHEQRRRNPDGVNTKKPIALRLMPQESKANANLAKRAKCSQSLLAAQAYRLGLPLLKKLLSQGINILDVSSHPASQGVQAGGDSVPAVSFHKS